MDLDRRSFLRAGMGAAGALVLWSCGRSPNGDSVVVADPSVPSPRLDLRLPGADYGFPSPFNYSPPAYSRVTYVYDTLLAPDPNTGTAEPWLATRYERSPDGLTYTFDLRDGVRWHDGRPFSADDVVFSFEYFKAKQQTLPPFLIFRPENVASVTATGANRVEIRLEKPVVTFPRAVAATFPIVPRHIWAGVGDPSRQQELAMLVGTGPYRLESYSRGQGGYLFTANDDFFLGKPFVKRIELRPVTNELVALRAGDVDAGGPPGSGEPVSAAVLKPFRGKERYHIMELPYAFPTAIYWNLGKGGALADVRFRHACARAIDRPGLVSRVLGGLGAPGNPGFLPPGHPYRVEVEQYPFDPRAANRILDDAGYRRSADGTRVDPDGKPLRLEFVVLPVLQKVMEVVREDLREIGVELELDPVDPFQLFLGTPDYDMAMLFHGGVDGDPDIMRGVYASNVQKAFFAVRGYVNPEFDQLAERQLVTFDEADRRQIVARMQQIVAADIPMLHLYYPTPVFVFDRFVFDQYGTRSPVDKRIMVTGLRSGTTVRPVEES